MRMRTRVSRLPGGPPSSKLASGWLVWCSFPYGVLFEGPFTCLSQLWDSCLWKVLLFSEAGPPCTVASSQEGWRAVAHLLCRPSPGPRVCSATPSVSLSPLLRAVLICGCSPSLGWRASSPRPTQGHAASCGVLLSRGASVSGRRELKRRPRRWSPSTEQNYVPGTQGRRDGGRWNICSRGG